MIRTGLLAGLLLVVACENGPQAGKPEAAPAPDTSGPRPAAESVGRRDSIAADSAPVRDEPTAAMAPGAQDWTARNTAVQSPAGRPVTLRSVRESQHPGFDRIVFDFDEPWLPGYRLEYVDTPQHQCGSGAEVRLKGEAWLAIRLQPAQAHDDRGMPTVTARDRLPGYRDLLELRLTCDFEGHVEWVAGVASPNGYRVLVLEQPTRLVVDLKH